MCVCMCLGGGGGGGRGMDYGSSTPPYRKLTLSACLPVWSVCLCLWLVSLCALSPVECTLSLCSLSLFALSLSLLSLSLSLSLFVSPASAQSIVLLGTSILPLNIGMATRMWWFARPALSSHGGLATVLEPALRSAPERRGATGARPRYPLWLRSRVQRECRQRVEISSPLPMHLLFLQNRPFSWAGLRSSGRLLVLSI